VFAIKINGTHWLLDVLHPKKDRIDVFSTEKNAIKQVEYLKKHSQFTNIDLQVVKVEEEILIHMKKGIHRQTIRELET
jgi:hypothetical protein